jgi:DMSO/TMAO reductase YedYZ molybdopterin-dependent catalytic subunit
VCEVLQLAGIAPDAVDALFVGLDKHSPEHGFRRPLPIAKAMHPDTLLVYAMNGEILPKDHGFPLRLVVPGWVGSSSVKWLERIVVSSQRLWSRNNTTAYVLVGENYPPEGEAEGQVATTQTIKSALALPWAVQLPAGVHRIYGYAHSPFGRIEKVEWSSDGGVSWQAACVLNPQLQYSWARFVFTWEAKPGEQTLLTRATDSAGNTQPDDVPLNREGYLFNAPVPHPVMVVSVG